MLSPKTRGVFICFFTGMLPEIMFLLVLGHGF